MDIRQRNTDLAEGLRLLARHEPRWRPLLHRAARALEDELPPAERRAIRGRYGGRGNPPPLSRPVQAASPDRATQDALL